MGAIARLAVKRWNWDEPVYPRVRWQAFRVFSRLPLESGLRQQAEYRIDRDSTLGEAMEHFLDITADICPMTFVRTRLLIEQMASGDTATILLRGAEPIENVPASVVELGHAVAGLQPLNDDPARERLGPGSRVRDGDICLRIVKT